LTSDGSPDTGRALQPTSSQNPVQNTRKSNTKKTGGKGSKAPVKGIPKRQKPVTPTADKSPVASDNTPDTPVSISAQSDDPQTPCSSTAQTASPSAKRRRDSRIESRNRSSKKAPCIPAGFNTGADAGPQYPSYKYNKTIPVRKDGRNHTQNRKLRKEWLEQSSSFQIEPLGALKNASLPDCPNSPMGRSTCASCVGRAFNVRKTTGPQKILAIDDERIAALAATFKKEIIPPPQDVTLDDQSQNIISAMERNFQQQFVSIQLKCV
jgi:hypothetical protein